MLQVILREFKNAQHNIMRPMLSYNRKKNWPTQDISSAKMMSSSFTQLGYLQNDQGVYQNSNSVVNYIDHLKSKGSYVVDSQGNTMLDLTGSGELNPLGYNHKLF